MITNKIKKSLALLLSVIVIASFTGCSSAEQADNNQVNTKTELSAVEKIQKSGKLVLGTSADYPPYEFHVVIDNKDTIVGFDIEIAKEIAKDLGVELVIVDMKFDGLLAALETGSVDIVIAGMTPTPERAQSVDFSQIYYTAAQSILVRRADAAGVKTVEDLTGKRIGAQKGAIQEEIAKEQIPQAKVQALGKIFDLVLELKNKKIDAVVMEYNVAKAYASKNEDLAITDIILDEDGGSAVAVKKGSQELLEQIDVTLDRLIEQNLIEKFVTEATELSEKQ